jgi:hypothetical protein
MACEKFKIALPPSSSKSASLELYTGELEKRVRNLISASSRCELRRLKLASSHAFLVRQGAFSGFSVNVKPISASSAEIRVRASSKAAGLIVDFIAIPGLVCALATFFVLWLGLLDRGVFIVRGFRFAGLAAFLVLVAFLVVAFLLKSVIMSVVHLFRKNEFDGERLHTIVNNLKSVPFPVLPLPQGLMLPTHDKLPE